MGQPLSALVMKGVKRALKGVAEGVVARAAPAFWRMRQRPRLLVLMYHRVLPAEHPDRLLEQPGMYVSPATFSMHLETLRRHFKLVHLDDWVREASQDMPLPRLACALTFDDGWQDNFEYAFPALEQHAVPATIFLVSTLTGTSHEFWPNRLGRLLMGSSPLLCLPPSLEQVLEPVLSSARSKNTWHRDDLDRAVELAKRIDEYEIHSILDELESARPHVAPSRRAVLNQEEVREMAASGLVRFGSHTRTHYRFRGEIAEEVLEREIGLSRVEVIRDAGGPAEVFCYPNGDVTEAAVDRVRQHYLAAVTTRAGWHVADADPHLMQRIGVHEDVSDTPASFLARISGWL